MSFREELAAEVAEIRRLAVRMREVEYLYDREVYDATHYNVPDLPGWGEVSGAEIAAIDSRLRVYDPLDRGDPARIEGMYNDLDAPDGLWSALTKTQSGDIPTLIDIVDDWTGSAADNFHLEFIDKFVSATAHQLALVVEIKRAVRAYQELLTHIRTDVIAIARDTQGALEALDQRGSVDFTVAFTIAGIVASAVSAPVAVGTAISVAGLLAGLVTAAGDAGAGPARERTVRGDTVAAVFDSMDEAIGKLYERIGHEDGIIVSGLQADLDMLAVPGYYDFVVQKPAVLSAGGDSRDAFARPRDGRPLAVVYGDLYVAGATHLPAIAYNYERARLHFNAIVNEQYLAFGPWFGASSGPWQSICETLQNILLDTRTYLSDSGQVLCEIAAGYAQSDNVGAEFMAHVGGYLDAFDSPLYEEPTETAVGFPA